MVDELIMLDQNRIALEAKLIGLLNRSPDTSMGKPEDLLFKKLPIDVKQFQISALNSNPSLKGMKNVIEAKKKAQLLAKKEYYPDFTVRFAYGQRDDGPEIDRRDMLTTMFEVNIPIYYKSKQSRKVLEAEAEVQMAEAQYLSLKNEIFYMIANMASMIQRTERQLDLYKTGIIPQASLQVNSALSAYTVNKTNFADLLDSQMALYRYELTYHQALTEYEKNLSALELAIGERFSR